MCRCELSDDPRPIGTGAALATRPSEPLKALVRGEPCKSVQRRQDWRGDRYALNHWDGLMHFLDDGRDQGTEPPPG